MKYLVLGAGPAGLTVVNKLIQLGEKSLLIVEKEKTPGGLCRSINVDGSPFDIGGGHFLDVKRPHVIDYLFQFMPENEWDKYERNSQILIHNNMINSPIEANIWQLPLEQQVNYLKSIAIAGCNLEQQIPSKFIDWIYWKLGDKIASDYMIPYNQKMFADDLDELGTYWLDKLPNVSFDETLLSCLKNKAYGTQPGHAAFYYPKKCGYGEVWTRIADLMKEHIIYDAEINCINFDRKEVITSDGMTYKADIIINTIPWLEFKQLIGMPKELKESIKKLKYSSIETRYFDNNIDTDAQWIYYPDAELPYHRILVRHNFCPNSKGYWTETRKERSILFDENEMNRFHYLNKYAYPLNTVEKPVIMKNILSWCKTKDVYGLGRWGEHQHYNSDVVVERALKMGEKLFLGREL